MKKIFEFLMDNYLIDESKLVDSGKKYYQLFIKEAPKKLKKFFPEDKYLIKSAIGAGQRSEIPWLCIFNKSVAKSATQGIYICYLFKKDMSGFYLVLGQGITIFEKLYGKDKILNIKKVANYFKELITDTKFDKKSIILGGNNELSKGYEAGTIISKYYDTNNYSENELLLDLSNMKGIYDDICENLVDSSYMEIVNNIVANMDPSYIIAEEASKLIERALLEEIKKEEIEIITLERVDIPKVKKENKYSEITKKTIKKLDYIKKIKSNANNGLIGEELVMGYEKKKLIDLGREDLADKIRWISKEDDGTGYDIISFDVNKNGHYREIYIEVKTSEGNDNNIFFISSNEINVMEKLKDQYFVYRVFNIKTKYPKVFVLNYNEFKEKIKLLVDGYKAALKGE